MSGHESRPRFDCPSNLPLKYWAKLSERDRELYSVIRPRPRAAHGADVSLSGLEDFLAGAEKDVQSMSGKFELVPDFQRGHVWSEAQQRAFMESMLREIAKADVIFNCPGWAGDGAPGDLPENTMQCIDGLQRLTAIRRYLKDEITVFEGLRCSDLRDTPFRASSYRVHFEVHEIANRAELLQFYLDINFAGVKHTEEEGLRVRGLLAAAASSDKALAPLRAGEPSEAKRSPRPR